MPYTNPNSSRVFPSLPNLSNVIRWSLDLRWQAGGKPTGFSVKDPIWFRKDGVDVSQPDWDAFNSCNRQTLVEVRQSSQNRQIIGNKQKHCLWAESNPTHHRSLPSGIQLSH